MKEISEQAHGLAYAWAANDVPLARIAEGFLTIKKQVEDGYLIFESIACLIVEGTEFCTIENIMEVILEEAQRGCDRLRAVGK